MIMKATEIYQTIPSALLALIATGKIDAKELARQELEKRGMNEKGEWDRKTWYTFEIKG